MPQLIVYYFVNQTIFAFIMFILEKLLSNIGSQVKTCENQLINCLKEIMALGFSFIENYNTLGFTQAAKLLLGHTYVTSLKYIDILFLLLTFGFIGYSIFPAFFTPICCLLISVYLLVISLWFVFNVFYSTYVQNNKILYILCLAISCIFILTSAVLFIYSLLNLYGLFRLFMNNMNGKDMSDKKDGSSESNNNKNNGGPNKDGDNMGSDPDERKKRNRKSAKKHYDKFRDKIVEKQRKRYREKQEEKGVKPRSVAIGGPSRLPVPNEPANQPIGAANQRPVPMEPPLNSPSFYQGPVEPHVDLPPLRYIICHICMHRYRIWEVVCPRCHPNNLHGPR